MDKFESFRAKMTPSHISLNPGSNQLQILYKSQNCYLRQMKLKYLNFMNQTQIFKFHEYILQIQNIVSGLVFMKFHHG